MPNGSFAEEANKRYKRELHRYMMRRLRHPQDADDLSQDVLLRLLVMSDSKIVHKPLAFIYGTASHVLADHRIETEQRTEHVITDSETVDEYAGEGVIVEDMTAEQIDHQREIEICMRGLSATHAKVLMAHKGLGMSYDEVAEELNLSIHTVEKYVTQAKGIFRRAFRALEQEDSNPSTIDGERYVQDCTCDDEDQADRRARMLRLNGFYVLTQKRRNGTVRVFKRRRPLPSESHDIRRTA